MGEYVELSAMDLSGLAKLEDLLVRLAWEMVGVRESLEMTRTSSFTSNNKGDDTVVLLSDTWEIIDTPEEPNRRYYAYRAQARSKLPRSLGKCSQC